MNCFAADAGCTPGQPSDWMAESESEYHEITNPLEISYVYIYGPYIRGRPQRFRIRPSFRPKTQLFSSSFGSGK